MNNSNINALIYAKGIDLETYTLHIYALANIFENNNLNIAVFNLKMKILALIHLIG